VHRISSLVFTLDLPGGMESARVDTLQKSI
jgi:hypothetical protein